MRGLRFALNSAIMLVPIGLLGVQSVRVVRGVWTYLNTGARLAGVASVEATRALGREVRVGDVKITGNLWSLNASNRVELINVDIAEGPSLAGGRFAHVERASVWYNLQQTVLSSDQRVPLVSEVQIVAPRILLTRDRNGVWNFQQLLSKSPGTGRRFTDKISFENASLDYVDQVFPHGLDIPARPLTTRLHALNGVLLFRPDKSIAFDVAGVGQPDIVQAFQTSGVVQTSPLKLDAHVTAGQVALPFFAHRFVSSRTATLPSGVATIEVSLLYAPSPNIPANALDPSALTAQGTAQLTNVGLAAPALGSPVRGVKGNLIFTSDALAGQLSGRYGGTTIAVNGKALGLTRFVPIPHGVPRLVAGMPTLALNGQVTRADFAQLLHDLKVVNRFPQISAQAKTLLQSASGQGDVRFAIAGTPANPSAVVTGRVESLQARATNAGAIQARNLDIRAVLDNHVVKADVRGKVANGDIALRGQVATDTTGAFQVEGHARSLPLAPIGALVGRKLAGIGKLDVALRGRKGFTPYISAQAQLSGLKLNNQSVNSVYARAATVGRQLVLRTLRVEDAKGVAFANGTLDLSSQRLNLNLAADELDLGAFARAFGLSRTLNVKPAPLTVGEPAPLFDLAGLQGVGYVRGKVGGTLRLPEASGQISAYAIQAGRAGLDKLVTDFRVSARSLKLANGTALRYPGKVAFGGTVDNLRSPQPRVNLTARVNNFDIADLLRLAQNPQQAMNAAFVVTGSVSTDAVNITGTPTDLTITRPVTLSLNNATLNGLPIEQAQVQARLTPIGAELIGARANVADGTVAASGRIGRKGDLKLRLDADNINVERVLAALPETLGSRDLTAVKDTDLAGHVSLHALVNGTVRDPHATATLSGTGLNYNGFAIGDAQAEARYANRTVQIPSATLLTPNLTTTQPGTLAISGLTYQLDNQTLGGEILWNNLTATRLRNLFLTTPLAQTESGQRVTDELNRFVNLQTALLSGSVALGGTVSEPRADIAFDVANLEVAHQRFSSIGGSARVTKNDILIPSPRTPTKIVRLASDNATIDVPRADVQFGGDVNAELSAYNVNLDFLRTLELRRRDLNSLGLGSLWPYLRPNATTTIGGQGDLFVVASGQTRAPVLDVSLNLRNFGVTGQTIDRIDVSHATIQEGKIQADNIEVVKTARDKDNNPVRFVGRAEGSIGFSWKPPYITKDAPVSFDASLPEQPITSLSAFAPQSSLSSDGVFSVQAAVRNTLANPLVTGSVAVRAGKLQFGKFETGLRDLNGVLDFEQDRLVVRDGFTARSQVYRNGDKSPRLTGEPITLSGSLPITGGNANAPGIALQSRRFYFEERNTPLTASLVATARGDAALNLRVTGSLFSPTLAGDVRLSNAVASPPQGSNGTGGAAFVPPINPELNLRVLLENNVRLLRPGVSASLDARADGEIDITGRLVDPVDRIAIARGEAQATDDLNTPDIAVREDAADEQAVAEGPKPGVRVFGRLAVREGRLTLPTARFRILPPGQITLTYPSVDETNPGVPTLGFNVDIKAQTYLTATSRDGTRKRYQVTVAATGPLTAAADPITGQSRLTLNVSTNPPDLAGNQQETQQRLAGLLGADALTRFGANPGQVLAQQFTNVFTSSVLPTIFDRPAEALGFEELSINYDPVQRLNLLLSRRLFGPLYVTYTRGLSGGQEMYTLKFSYRISDRVQLSYEQDEQNTNRVLLESVLRF